MKKYRVKPGFSLNGLTGRPESVFNVQERIWGKWFTLPDGVHTDAFAASGHARELREAAAYKRARGIEKRRALMRRLSGRVR